jgi:ribosomal protein S18 acetylase RimI-like enzyme
MVGQGDPVIAKSQIPTSDLQERITIRPVAAEDLPGLEWDGAYTSHRSVFRQTFEQAQQGQRVMLIAVASETVIGQVFIQLVSSELEFANGVDRGYLYALRVRPGWQGQGLGTRLIAAAEAELRSRGFTTAVIAVGKDNLAARRLYERLGYRAFADDPGVWYFTDVNGVQQTMEEPCWVMEKMIRDE